MEPIIKINCLQINNLKNIEAGTIKTNSIFENLEKSDIVGVYGQNGSGKTAVVEAFKILQTLLGLKELPNRTKKLVKSNAQTLELKFDYLITNKYGEYTLKYQVKLGYRDKDENLSVFNESLIYRENQPRKRMKVLVEKIGSKIRIRNNEIKDIKEDGRVKILLANEISYSKKTSFIFRKEYKGVRDSLMTLEEIELVDNLVNNFNKDFHVIDNSQAGIIFANILIPFSFQLPQSKGQLALDLNRAMLLPKEIYDIYDNIIDQVNIVLKKIIPGLMVVINKISNETTEEGEEGVRFELLSDNNGVRLPLRCESAGVLKLISILSTLISVYNNPNACVVIDELDSGIFEYLLGDLVEIIKDNGKGQLFFTSHNLRILEVLAKENIWFTSTNPQNRFIQLKMVKKLSNMRDMYLRAVQLGGQEESLYNETDSYSIRKAFREAGKKDAKKVIIVIVEGFSDETLLIERLQSLYLDSEIRFEIQFGDIFYDSVVKDSPKKIIGDVINDIRKKRKYLSEDILAILHIMDTDGCFIARENVVVNQVIKQNTHYTLTNILVDGDAQKERIIKRNKKRSNNIRTMTTIDKIISKKYPYQLFYFSRNLEHVIFDNPNPDKEGKVEDVEEFTASLNQPIEEHLKHLLPILTTATYSAQYKESWHFIETELNSLNRYSNVSLLFKFIDQTI